MADGPHQAVAALFEGDGRLLVVRENYDRRRYTFPGGALEAAESPFDAVVGETREEACVGVQVDHLVNGSRGVVRDGLPRLT